MVFLGEKWGISTYFMNGLRTQYDVLVGNGYEDLFDG